jgi:hypothetical protein
VDQPNDYDLRALRIDKNGNILWQKSNEPIIVSERAGGYGLLLSVMEEEGRLPSISMVPILYADRE